MNLHSFLNTGLAKNSDFDVFILKSHLNLQFLD